METEHGARDKDVITLFRLHSGLRYNIVITVI